MNGNGTYFWFTAEGSEGSEVESWVEAFDAEAAIKAAKLLIDHLSVRPNERLRVMGVEKMKPWVRNEAVKVD